MRRYAVLLALLLGCSGISDAPTAPLALRHDLVTGQGSYIVVLKSGQAPSNAHRVFSHVFNGYAVDLSDLEAEALKHNPNVESVSPEVEFSINETWGLDRIDQRSLPLDNSYSPDRCGRGVHAYMVDTGIRITHSEFTGRISNGADFVDGGSPDDDHGHGTHTSGTVGGTTYGVAKCVTIHPVRVIGSTGSAPSSQIIQGLDWVAQNRILPCVVNMSIGGPADPATDQAVESLASHGCVVSVAGGNDNADACNYSPSRTPNALTVGATDNTDYRAWFSNWGNCVDLFAPGMSVLSAWYTGDSATGVLSGTSMAAPHVTGVAALYLEGNPNASPSEVSDSLKAYSTKGVVQNSLSANWNLLYSGRTIDATSPGNPSVPEVPVAPSNLTVRVVGYSGGKGRPVTFHSEWQDNSGNEIGFLIIGSATNGDYTQRVAALNETSLDFTDGSGVWTFHVVAYRFIGQTRFDSPPSNSVTVSACERRCR